ncbi:glucosaminidase [Bacillus cereus]|uniref:S-layer homology domain-containing protein n=1 Tax=Bacillus TaxID=1386 RepID=UPI000BF355FF|nr:S-layer homology domain-containing protein [Bacillus cereus]RFB71490.1 glucosaminidase [Bacillus sp. AW]HDR8169676.1 S-layer homology domain-containing protein [Bacillus thuringiensis]PFM92623.1 glucosaminidase [Bacillus cereus]PFQ93559.1 glucosaminidase [Bacillus cereus]
MKKFSKGITAVALTGSLLLTPISSYAASDDITGHLFEQHMRTLINKGIMSGYGNDVYLPDKEITRAEFATLVAKALQLPQADSNFNDVPKTYGLYDGVSRAFGAGIIKGRSPEAFAPNDVITREEMAVMVKQALDYKKVNVTVSPLTFADTNRINYKEHVQVMVATGIIKGYPEDNTFRPHLSATRGMASAMLNLMLDKIGGGETPVETKNYVLLNDAGKVVERYTTYKEAVTAAQNKGINAVKYENEYVWIKDGFATAKRVNGNTINIYGENLKTVYTYLEYGTEFKVLEVGEDRVKVQLSDLTGYVKKNEVTLVPEKEMQKSYYYVANDGYLYHRYYEFEKKPSYTGYRYGAAPAFMKPGQQMESIDGKTFGNETFYQYFNYLSLRSKTEYTAEQLDSYVKSVRADSPLIGLGKKFKEVESKYNVNALFLYSLAVHESLYGTSELARDKNNLFGLNATDNNPFGNGKTFNSKEDCIEDAAKVYMNEWYLNPGHWRYTAAYTGDKAGGINMNYASDANWGKKVAGHMFRFDSYLGKKEYNKYKLARVTNKVEVKKDPRTSGAKLYSLSPNKVVTITGEETINGQAWVKIISDDPAVNEAYVAKENVEYVKH